MGLTTHAVTRFRREAAAAAKLHHTNIVPIYATGDSDGMHYYAMELIDGPSLDKVIKQMRREHSTSSVAAEVTRLTSNQSRIQSEPPHVGCYEDQDELAATVIGPRRSTLDPRPSTTEKTGDTTSTLGEGQSHFAAAARMIADVADALDYAHKQGVIHRDIKPSNLLLSPATSSAPLPGGVGGGLQGRLSINDFGLARMLEEPGMTITGEFLGSPSYMSPEQIAAGRVKLDHRTDIYSLGAALYELLTLQPPFTGQSRDQILGQIMHKEPKALRGVNKKIPVDLETICLKAMEKDPDRRYQTGGEMAEDLRRYVNRFEISARRAGPIQRTVKWARRRAVFQAAAASTTFSASDFFRASWQIVAAAAWKAAHR